MNNIKYIVTHDSGDNKHGGAHNDEFLAASFLAHKFPDVNIIRKSQPSKAELADPNIIVLDFGRDYNLDLKNFDHHQMKTSVENSSCAFTLVLEYFGMRDYQAIPWIKWVETCDHHGPPAAIKYLFNTESGSELLLYNPIVATVLNLFSKESLIEGKNKSMLRTFMELIGKEIQDCYDSYVYTYKELSEKAKLINYENIKILDLTSCDFTKIPRSISAEARYQKEIGQTDCILNINERGTGKLRLIRRGEKLDFNLAKDVDANISFIHQSGFLIVFDDINKVEEICKLSIVK